MIQTPGPCELAKKETPAATAGVPTGPPVPVVFPAVRTPSSAVPVIAIPTSGPKSNPWLTGVGAMIVRDVMTHRVVKVSSDATLRHAAQLLLKNHISGMPVVDHDKIVGVLSEKDIVRVMLSRIGRSLLPSHLLALFLEITAEEEARTLGEIQEVLEKTKVSHAMSDHPIVIEAEAPLDHAMREMIQHGVHRLPVVEHGKLVGILTREDALRGSVGVLE